MSIQQLHHQAQNAINHRDFVKAHGLCVQIIQQQPEHADAYFLLGIINSEIGQINKAIQLIEKAVGLELVPEYLAYLAKCYSLVGDMQKVVATSSLANIDSMSSAQALDTMGVALSRAGLHRQALSYFEKALSKIKDNAAIYYNYAVSSKFAGLFQQARDGFEQAIKLKPDYYQAHFALSDLGDTTKLSNHIERLRPLFEHATKPEAKLHYGHALAKEYEAAKAFDKAFSVLANAKSMIRAQSQYKFEQDKQLFDVIDTQVNLEQCSNVTSNRPIFVMGMPRSGTTLVERILSSHSAVASGGELQEFGLAVKELTATQSQQVLDVETLIAAENLDFSALGRRYLERTAVVGQEKTRFVDKLPFNFFYLGLLLRALPNAKIICLLRHPMDTCVGNFRQLFSIHSPHYLYSHDLLDIGRFYVQFLRLVESWQGRAAERMRLLDYQRLVQAPNKEIPALIEFCALPWQKQCLHAERNQAPVSTASKVQVREPINTKSIGRWRQYQAHTAELEQFLQSQGISVS